MADSAPTPPDGQPRLTDRKIGRRRLLAVGAVTPIVAPIVVAAVKASGGLASSTGSGSPPLADAATRTPDSQPGSASSSFC